MSESKAPLTDREMDYGTTTNPPAAAATGGMQSPDATLPPPHPSDLSEPPPPYESLDLDPSARRPSCGHHPSGAGDYTEAAAPRGKDYYDAGDYRQLNACIVLSCLVLCFFNPMFGIIAFIIAVLGKKSEAKNDYDRASRYAKISCYVSLAGVIVAAIVACVLLTVFLARPG